MAEAGLEARVDAVGNVWGLLAGREPGRRSWPGSHFDTVPDGGKYDGQLGLVGALVAVEALRGQLGQPRRSLAVLAACEEEGSRFDGNFWASRAIIGEIGPDEAERIRDFDGVRWPTRCASAGTTRPARRGRRRRSRPSSSCTSSRAGAGAAGRGGRPGRARSSARSPPITGTGRLQVTLRGQPDHTGTTPMLGRRDALLGAAEVALALREMALGSATRPADVARLEVIPNIPNVVPGGALLGRRAPPRRARSGG